MATTATAAVAHQLPPMSIPPMPRIRPPRLLKGDPHPNNAPPPAVKPKEGQKWIQGRYRAPNSRAVKHKRAVQDIQVTKAVRHQTHGLDIYAYRHIRTKQVVYSLSRTLQENKILKQLIYHGKKTVPASVRSDMWTPYFSIHFPPTPAGALEGLFAFQKLRELSMQRQLDPPNHLIRVTQEDVDTKLRGLGSPTTLQEMAVHHLFEGKKAVPRVGEILPKKMHAKRLMNQEATSVADVSFVLDWILSGPSPWERLTAVETNRLLGESQQSHNNKLRLARINEKIKAKAQEIRKRAALAVKHIAEYDHDALKITSNTLEKLSMEHHGIFSAKGRLQSLDRERYNNLRDIHSYDSLALRQQLLNTSSTDLSDAIRSMRSELDLFKARQRAGRAAEKTAMETWFAKNESPTTGPESVWESVKLAREDALDAFDSQARLQAQRDDIAAMENAEQAKIKAEAKNQRRIDAGHAPKPSPPFSTPTKSSEESTLLSRIRALEPSYFPTPDSPSSPIENPPIRILWTDANDGNYASSWPSSVIHSTLTPLGAARNADTGAILSEDNQRVSRITKKSVHIIGSDVDDGWVEERHANGRSGVAPTWETGVENWEGMPEARLETEYKDIREETEEVEERRVGLLEKIRGWIGR